MSNSLILSSNGTALSVMQQAIMSEMDAEGNAGYEFIPERIKLGAGGMLAFQSSDGSILQPPFEGVIVIAQRARAYWPVKGTGSTPPLCSSRDGLQGHYDIDSVLARDAVAQTVRHPATMVLDPAAIPGPWECAACPLSEFGSAPVGNGQACKALRRLVVLIKGWAAPVLLTLPPTSCKIWDQYVSGRRSRGKAYFDTWSRIGLVSDRSAGGNDYAKLAISAGEPLSEGQLADVIAMRRQYEELVREMGIASEEYETVDASPTPVTHDDEELNPF
jgi:hypothetical protein